MYYYPLQALSKGIFALENKEGCSQSAIKVHSVFQRVINLTREDGFLTSISRIDVPNGPANIITNLPSSNSFMHYGIKPGTSGWVDFSLSSLKIGELHLSFQNVPLWVSPLASRQKPPILSSLEHNLCELTHWTASFASSPSGFLPLFSHLENLERGIFLPDKQMSSFTSFAGQAICGLLPALQAADYAAIKNAVCSLIGLGPGLTPSGDDYLTGLLVSLYVAAQVWPETFLPLSKLLQGAVLTQAPGSTHDLSFQMLCFAAQGLGGEALDTLIFALLSSAPSAEALRQSAEKLGAIGATSGFDQLLGVLSGFRFALRQLQC